jgi:alcohol dehydrogenase (cytochrome c)
LSASTGAIKWGYQYTPNDPYDFDEISEHPIINVKVNGEDRKLVVHAARNGFFYALDRVNGSFVHGKQYVNELNWTTGLDPKTGRPLNYDPTKDVQEYTVGSHSNRQRPESNLLCPAHTGGKNWEPGAYNPELGLLYIPSIEGCNKVFTEEQKDFVDQGGTVKPRDRFAGGCSSPTRTMPEHSRPPATWCLPATSTARSRRTTPRRCRRSGASISAPGSMRRRSPTR